VAAIEIAPVPSDEIVAPSKLIELEERNISFHLLLVLPKLYVFVAEGRKSELMLCGSSPPPPTVPN